MLDPKTRRLRLATASRVAHEIEAAAERSSVADRLLFRLREAIRAGEREHQAFGARLLGRRPIRRATMGQIVDLFTAAIVLRYMHDAPTLAALAPLREDHQIGAMLASLPEFRERFAAGEWSSPERCADVARDLDYSEIVPGE